MIKLLKRLLSRPKAHESHKRPVEKEHEVREAMHRELDYEMSRLREIEAQVHLRERPR